MPNSHCVEIGGAFRKRPEFLLKAQLRAQKDCPVRGKMEFTDRKLGRKSSKKSQYSRLLLAQSK